MKNILYLLLFVLLCNFTACAQRQKDKNNFTLKGSITGKKDRTIWLTYPDSGGKKHNHVAHVKNGMFLFKGSISSPVHADLLSYRKSISDSDSRYAEIFLSPGSMTVTLREGDFEHSKVTGSPMQDDWNNLQKAYEPTNKIRDSLDTKRFELEKAGNTPKNHLAHVAIVEQLDKCQLEADKIEYNYMYTHPQSYLSAYLLENCLGADMPLDSIEMFYNAFSVAVKGSVSGKAIEKVIVNRKASAVGSIARMPSGTNINGRKFEPKTIKINNFLVLYFWASYANDNPQLKMFYKKYHPKGLTIIGISMDPFEKMWRDTVQKEHISIWHNIFSDPVANLDTFYNIRQMAPSLMLLLDKDHRIIGRYRGNGVAWYKFDYDEGNLTDLDKKLSELYKKYANPTQP